MKDWDYSHLANMVLSPEPLNAAARAEIAITITRMSKEIGRLQELEYLKPSDVKSFGNHLMFRTDDEDNTDGVPCVITQCPGGFYLVTEETYNGFTCQNILTLDPEVRFKKI